jgi:hypothetical protein
MTQLRDFARITQELLINDRYATLEHRTVREQSDALLSDSQRSLATNLILRELRKMHAVFLERPP